MSTEEYFVETLIDSSRWKTFLYYLTTNIDYVKCQNLDRNYTPEDYKEITLHSEYLSKCILEISEKSGEGVENLKIQAKKYLDEIGLGKNLTIIKWAAISNLLYTRILDVRVFASQPTINELKASMGSCAVLILPTHRSYADFMFWTHTFLLNNLMFVNSATGTNLMNIPGWGKFSRVTGSFFIRRTVEDGSLYETTLNEYVKTLLQKSPAAENIYLEGTRCRTNKSQPPKYGLLAMCMAPLFSGDVSDITLVPMHIAYERLMENYLYACELLGIPKPPETAKSILKAHRLLNGSFGHVHVNFASPISLKQHLKDYDFENGHKPVNSRDLSLEQFKLVQEVGDYVVSIQQDKSVVNVTYLLATILMNCIIKNEVLDFDQVLAEIDWLIQILSDLGVEIHITDVKKDLERVLYSVLCSNISVDEDKKLRLIFTEVVNISDKLKNKIQGHVLKTETMENAVPIISLQLYVNPLLHYFVPATIIYLLARNGVIKRDDVKIKYDRIRKILKHDFFYFEKTEGQNFKKSLKFCEQHRVVISSGDSIVMGDNVKLQELLQWAIWPTLDTLLNTSEIMIKLGTSEHKTALKEVQEELEKRHCHPYSLSLDVIANCLQGLAAVGALKRNKDPGFKYDNILMEESAQILEIETFIPLLLQNPQDGRSRLKRWIMIGDHHQLPPVVKNMAFQKYCNMEQSLFTRMVRLGVPYVELDAQGRARSSICNLYRWRYLALGDLGHVSRLPEYRAANAGFRYDFQLINVDDFNGAGETEPSPYFYQNLAEAEYVVAVFMYMRLVGWPADRVSILTTYNGQKHLIRDVIDKRCADNPLIGRPHKVTTVDKYQGQQNDVALISLVRTKAVGHVRDLRRLIVAASRARLGLYIFARANLFRNCFELQPTFNQLVERPLQLELVPGERYPAQRGNAATVPPPLLLRIQDMPHMAKHVYDMYLDIVREHQQKPSQWSAPGAAASARSQEPEHFVPSHPGAAPDSDDEDTFKPTEIVNEVQDVPME